MGSKTVEMVMIDADFFAYWHMTKLLSTRYSLGPTGRANCWFKHLVSYSLQCTSNFYM